MLRILSDLNPYGLQDHQAHHVLCRSRATRYTRQRPGPPAFMPSSLRTALCVAFLADFRADLLEGISLWVIFRDSREIPPDTGDWGLGIIVGLPTFDIYTL